MINAACGTGTAAQVASSYSLGGYSDWYLPSKDELNLLYLQRDVVGNFNTSGSYGSSSETGPTTIWYQVFDSYGGQYWGTKGSPFPVRAVRTF
jgi:hypothetical protein